jgi:hypothetical protein
MVPGGELGHHPPIECVQVDLAVQFMRQQPPLAVEDGDRTFVTGRFEGEYPHAFCLLR